MSAVSIDSTGSTAVDNNYFWQPIEKCPRGVKVQLIGDSGVAMYGTYNGKGTSYTHWAPLPKFKKDGSPDEPYKRVVDCATRLVEHANFKLGGCLSADSKAKDIPSNAVSTVKARHLASLRDALREVQ